MPRTMGSSRYGQPTYNQAYKIWARFNGPRRLAEILNINPATVYRWAYSRPLGSDGMIPTVQVDSIKSAARLHGVILTTEDWAPEKLKGRTPENAPIQRGKNKKPHPPRAATKAAPAPTAQAPSIDDLLS